MAHALGEELEKFLRFEVGCEERANSTIFSARQREELCKWQEKEERKIRRACIKGEVEGERDGARKRTGPAYMEKGGLHSQATMMQEGRQQSERCSEERGRWQTARRRSGQSRPRKGHYLVQGRD